MAETTSIAEIRKVIVAEFIWHEEMCQNVANFLCRLGDYKPENVANVRTLVEMGLPISETVRKFISKALEKEIDPSSENATEQMKRQYDLAFWLFHAGMGMGQSTQSFSENPTFEEWKIAYEDMIECVHFFIRRRRK